MTALKHTKDSQNRKNTSKQKTLRSLVANYVLLG